jgi:CheY-like chemotaxis protein
MSKPPGPGWHPLHVMLIEDDDADAMFVQRAFDAHGDVVEMVRVETGEEALERLAVPALRPDLVLLDLALPGIDGHAVLAAAKADPEMRRIPIVALTSSRSDEDVLKSWDLQVAGYLVKPIDLEAFRLLASSLVKWWSANELPSPAE